MDNVVDDIKGNDDNRPTLGLDGNHGITSATSSVHRVSSSLEVESEKPFSQPPVINIIFFWNGGINGISENEQIGPRSL